MAELFGIKYDPEEEKKSKPPLVSRRALLRSAAGAAAAGILGVGGPSSVDKAKDTFLAKELSGEIQKKVSLIKEMYGIEVKSKFNDLEKLMQDLLKITDEDISGVDEKNSLSKFNRSLEYIIQGFSRYPVSFIRKMNIRAIFIADNLFEGGGKVQGLTPRELGAGEMFLEISEGFLDKGRNFGWNEKRPFKKTLDHEFFHVLDNHILDNSQRFVWIGLDEPDAYDSDFKENKKGFVDQYSQTSTREDRASLFSAMMNNEDGVWNRSKTDEILKKKVLFLQQMMLSNTFGLIGREYWDLLEKGNLRSDFFQKRKAFLLSLNFGQFQQELKQNNWRKFTQSEASAKTEEEIFLMFRKNLEEMKI